MENLLFSESTTEPNFKLWDSLEAYKLDEQHINEIEVLPLNKYFEIPANHSSFGSVNMLFDEIRPDGDKSSFKKIAFKYSRNKKTGTLYLFILCMTNKSSKRCRDTPFIIEFIIQCSPVLTEGCNEFEGTFQIKPKKGQISDEVSDRKRIDSNISQSVKKSVVDNFSRNFPSDPNVNEAHGNPHQEPEKFDYGINVNSYALVRVKDVKNVSLARITAVTASHVLLEILKPKRKSPYR